MQWVNKFIESSFSLFSGNTVDAFQPLDFYHFYPQWYDLWIDRIDEALRIIDADTKSYQDLRAALSVPSHMRALLQKIIPSYRGFVRKNPRETRRVTEFFARMLAESCPADPFGMASTPLHREGEVRDLVSTTPWQEASTKDARMLGTLLTACASLTHGLYSDLGTDFGWDAYGPYTIDDGTNKALLVRHFPDLAPTDLWSNEHHAPYRDLSIRAVYENVKWKIACVGCHTIVEEGDPIAGMRQWAVIADGRALTVPQIEELTQKIAVRAEQLYRVIQAQDLEEIKRTVLLQECYQTKKMFDAAGMDWRPTADMIARISGTPLLTGLVPHGTLMTSVDQYAREFGFHEFASEVLKYDMEENLC